MSYFLFIDESGQDQRESPYEVLAGISVEDNNLWNLITTLQKTEIEHFGGRYSRGARELKGSNPLTRKTFRLASQDVTILDPERSRLAHECLERGPSAQRRQLTALAQAKLAFVQEAFIVAARFHCKCFASITNREAPRPTANYLRKDYAYLFERFFYFLEDAENDGQGIVVFDELEKSASHILLDQMHRYFRETATGRHRSSLIIPEPFFVHSDLTTGVQLADLVAYTISWGVRLNSMSHPARTELGPFARLVLDMRHQSVRERGNNPQFRIWSFQVLDDLRARIERGEIQ